MSTEIAKQSPLAMMAARLEINIDEMQSVIMATVMPAGGKGVTHEQFTAFVAVANSYGLDPLKREIYAFPAKGGGIQSVVGIDGWLSIIHSHPDYDGMELSENFDNGKIFSTTCTIYRKNMARPTIITEYVDECRRNTDTWKKPIRMMRHKATIQCARYAFGLSGIMEPDEAEAAYSTQERDITPTNNVSAIRRPESAPKIEVDPAPDLYDIFVSMKGFIATATNIEALESGGKKMATLPLEDGEIAELRRLYAEKKKELEGDDR